MPKHLGKVAFLISKPLQLMVALCIVKQGEWETKPVFVILGNFCEAQEVAERLQREFVEFQSAVFFESRNEALVFIKKEKYAHLYVDSDVGFKNFLTLASQKLSNYQLKIHVYEEGLGTYRTDLYTGIKKNLFDLLGIGVFFGACRFVSRIHVFEVEDYIENFPENKFKVEKISGSISNFLAENRNALKRLFAFDGVSPKPAKNSNCSIYLSNWSVDKEFIILMKRLNGDVFIKPHPHLRYCSEINGVRLIGAGVPAELVIVDLMDNYESVQVFDHNSSVRRYIFGGNLTYTSTWMYLEQESAALNVRSAI